MNSDNGSRTRRDVAANRFRVERHSPGIDICKYRHAVLPQHWQNAAYVRDGRHDELIFRFGVERCNREMNGCAAGRAGDRVCGAELCRELLLKSLHHRAAIPGEAAGAQRLEYEPLFFFAERAAGTAQETGQGFVHGWHAAMESEYFCAG